MEWIQKRNKWQKLGMVFLIALLDVALGPGLMMILRSLGVELYTAWNPEIPLYWVLLQNALWFLWPLVLLILTAVVLRKNFFPSMGLNVKGTLPKVWTGLLVFVLLFLAGVFSIRHGDTDRLFYKLFYYVFFIAFAEEFVYRGICPYLLEDFPWFVRYLLPSFLFAMCHIFAYGQFEPLSWQTFLRFLSSEMGAIMAAGCCLQILKDRSGTLWIPILFHALVDFLPELHI